MEEAIATLSKGLGSFCCHLQTSVDALKQSIGRRPIPLDSASSTFIQSLNRRVSTAGTDLTMLDSMSFGTVSFEELLGHCSEVFKRNQSDLLEVEDRLKGFGYIPELDVDYEDEVPDMSTPVYLDPKLPYSYDRVDPPSSYGGQVSVGCCTMKSLEDDSLCDDYLSLKSLGISDTSLATLASQAKGNRFESDICSLQSMEYDKYKAGSAAAMRMDLEASEGRNHTALKLVFPVEDDLMPVVAPPQPLVKVSKDEFEKLPSFMRTLVSWEELVEAMEKINMSLRKKEEASSGGGSRIFQDEISSLSLGTKVRSYLLLLVRMKQLVVETVDGLISYRVLQTTSENH